MTDHTTDQSQPIISPISSQLARESLETLLAESSKPPLPFQLDGIIFLFKHRRAILADQRGLGKTVQILHALSLKYTPETRVLIVSGRSGLDVWLRHLKEMMDIEPTLVEGPKEKRKLLWDNNFVLTTYDIVRLDAINLPIRSKTWDVIICDEAHKMKNRKTKRFKAFKKLRSSYLWLVTGSPASRGSQDLWGYLHLLNSGMFPSYWKFINTFCLIEKTHWGNEIIGPKNTEALRDILKGYLIRRLKKNVAPQMPPKTQQIIGLEMTTQQARIHNELVTTLIAELESEELLIAQNKLTAFIRLRQLLVSPRLLDPKAEVGAGLEYIVEQLNEGEPDDRHVVIFTFFASAIPIISDYLTEKLNFVFTLNALRGGVKTQEQTSRINQFKETKGIMLCSIAYAESFDLETATAAYFLGADWDPQVNYQAEDRLHRLTTDHPVNIYYLQHRDSVEERVFETLNSKQSSVNKIFRSNKATITALKETLL